MKPESRPLDVARASFDAAFGDVWREINAAGRRSHAGWQEKLFTKVALGAGYALWSALDEAERGEVVRAQLLLVSEAIGRGYLAGWSSGTPDLFSRCFVEAAPRCLPGLPAPARLPTLTAAWNLCEGLKSQPEWISLCVSALIATVDLSRFDAQVLEALKVLTTGAQTSTFRGPFELTVLDLRRVDDEFLPGQLHFASSIALCVHDRRTARRKAAVLVSKGSGARVFLVRACLGFELGPASAPKVEFDDGTMAIGNKRAVAPMLSSVHSQATSPSGLVAASAVDSQRLWVFASLS